MKPPSISVADQWEWMVFVEQVDGLLLCNSPARMIVCPHTSVCVCVYRRRDAWSRCARLALRPRASTSWTAPTQRFTWRRSTGLPPSTSSRPSVPAPVRFFCERTLSLLFTSRPKDCEEMDACGDRGSLRFVQIP